MMQVQVFGTRKCAETRKTLRFFAERRIKTHFVDLKMKAASVGELRRFAQKFGVEALVDRGSKRFQDKGLGTAHFGEDRWMTILSEELNPSSRFIPKFLQGRARERAKFLTE